MATDRDQDGINHKIPTWNGDRTTFSDYVLRVELRADATKKDDRFLLGPRLAGNLTGRAFDALGEVNREELRKEAGWKYLLDFLERGKEKIDVLGDLFAEFFANRSLIERMGRILPTMSSVFDSWFDVLTRQWLILALPGRFPQSCTGGCCSICT
jgi:hypothetical protein